MAGPDDNIDRDFRRGVALCRAGEYFASHEAFEAAWRRCEAQERDFFQGLVHAVVFAYQSGRGPGLSCAGPLAATAQRPAAALSASVRSVRSQEKSGSSRPKWP